MNQDWSDEELIEERTLEPGDYNLLSNRTGATRLGFAIQLKHFQIAARFPACLADIPVSAVTSILLGN